EQASRGKGLRAAARSPCHPVAGGALSMDVAGRRRRVLIIVENLPCPFDRRVWQEARALREHGYEVSIICPRGRGYDSRYEVLEGGHIYRRSLPVEADTAVGYALEYGIALI